MTKELQQQLESYMDDNPGRTDRGDEKKAFPFTDNAYWDTCGFMSAAMERDAGSEHAREMKSWNMKDVHLHDKAVTSLFSAVTGAEIEGDITALRTFKGLVESNGPWDYKPHLERRGNLIAADFKNKSGRFLGTTFPEDREYLYYYDIWSNMHYGYVGRSCGFSGETLLNGARYHDTHSGGLSSTESYNDELGIQIGMRLFEAGSVSSIAVTEELRFASSFFSENITKYRIENLVLD